MHFQGFSLLVTWMNGLEDTGFDNRHKNLLSPPTPLHYTVFNGLYEHLYSTLLLFSMIWKTFTTVSWDFHKRMMKFIEN